ncbi:MAG TPA: type II toxin-antitoxin system HicB family antitoxin [Candidatus Kapabacteria bacterium]|nr:type II toxin-antitoxin system HicB family antitoxin [Candidatus Kapabacteria bacterium]
MKKYMIIFEKTETGYSAYSPDVDGCIAVGDTLNECKINMEEALNYHIEFMLEKGYEIPEPSILSVDYININERNANSRSYAMA